MTRMRKIVFTGTAVAAIGAISYGTSVGSMGTGTAEAAPSPFTLEADCSPAGEPLSFSGAGTQRNVQFAGRDLMITAELTPGDRPAEVAGGVAASANTETVLQTVDARGDDRVLLSTDGGTMFAEVARGPDLRYPAVSPAGERAVWSAEGALIIASAAEGWTPTAIAMPGEGKQLAQYMRFVDATHLLLAVEVGVDGVDPEEAALSDLWTLDLTSNTWTKLTAGVADEDRWSFAKTPVVDKDGSVLYVRQTGLASGTLADVRTELRRIPVGNTGGQGETLVTAVPDRWGLVDIDENGTTLWNAPDEASQWQLVRWSNDGARTSLGCGRAAWAPELNHDPDKS